MKRVLIALTVVNIVLLTFSLARPGATRVQDVAPVLRGRALEIVDERGRVRASITVFPADPTVKMPDGTTGYPETVLLRLRDSKGRPNVKDRSYGPGGRSWFRRRGRPDLCHVECAGHEHFIEVA